MNVNQAFCEQLAGAVDLILAMSVERRPAARSLT
jgi:hypothetical protein